MSELVLRMITAKLGASWSRLAEGATLSHLETTLAKSEWGLSAEQTHLLVCGLLRGGLLAANDTRGQVIGVGQIGIEPNW